MCHLALRVLGHRWLRPFHLDLLFLSVRWCHWVLHPHWDRLFLMALRSLMHRLFRLVPRILLAH